MRRVTTPSSFASTIARASLIRFSTSARARARSVSERVVGVSGLDEAGIHRLWILFRAISIRSEPTCSQRFFMMRAAMVLMGALAFEKPASTTVRGIP